MRLFAGLDRTDYQDLLRAIGAHLDAARLCDLRLVEDETGLIVQVRRADDLSGGFLTYRLTEDDCLAMLRAAYSWRGSGSAADGQGAATRASGFPPAAVLGYGATLRGVGRLLDAAGWRVVRVVELPGALLVQGTPGGGSERHPITQILTRAGFYEGLRALGAAAGADERHP